MADDAAAPAPKPVQLKLTGAPDLPALEQAGDALVKLVNSVGADISESDLTFTIMCDDCGKQEPFDPTSEQAIWDLAGSGWTRTDEGHYCPTCTTKGTH